MWPGGIVVVERDRKLARTVIDALASEGLDAKVTTSPDLAVLPEVVVVVGDGDGRLCRAIRDQHPLLPLVAVIRRRAKEHEVLTAGVNDVVRAPVSGPRLRLRLESAAQLARASADVAHLALARDLLVSARALLPDELDDSPELADWLENVAQVLGFEWCALLAYVTGSEFAFVVSISTHADIQNTSFPISDAPSVAAVLRGETAGLYIPAREETDSDALELFGAASLALFPIVAEGTVVGALAMGGAASHDGLDEELALLLTDALRGPMAQSRVVETLRDQTRRISRVAYEADRQMKVIEPLRDHFEGSSDGVLVLNRDGDILFANGTAGALTGFAVDGLMGHSLSEFVAPNSEVSIEDVIGEVLSGENVEAFDLDLSTTSEQPICVSVTTSTVLSKEGAAVFSFRDVTQQRELEAELQQTTGFLEKLIESAVDAIIAADIRGQVVLFNPGAERIFGYKADEVIGKVPIWKLYPEGVAKELMVRLRSDDGGGRGRVEQMRNNVLNKDGEVVPVNMSAAIMYEDDKEIASFGIFSDLRQQLAMEERLAHVQHQLEEQERRAMVAQLAGAAAHELNQPLTSIMAYTSWIERHGSNSEKGADALRVIMEQAERMADIVKNVGQITKYETKEYVGSASILDLDRSSRHEPPAVGVIVPERGERSAGDPDGTTDAVPEEEDFSDEVTRPGLRIKSVGDEES